MKLNIVAVGVAFGAVAALYLGTIALLGWWYPGYASGVIAAISTVYLGLYKATPGGALIGLVFGFVDAFICGVILAWVYNKVSSKKS